MDNLCKGHKQDDKRKMTEDLFILGYFCSLLGSWNVAYYYHIRDLISARKTSKR